jgi:hypothetical protein
MFKHYLNNCEYELGTGGGWRRLGVKSVLTVLHGSFCETPKLKCLEAIGNVSLNPTGARWAGRCGNPEHRKGNPGHGAYEKANERTGKETLREHYGK